MPYHPDTKCDLICNPCRSNEERRKKYIEVLRPMRASAFCDMDEFIRANPAVYRQIHVDVRRALWRFFKHTPSDLDMILTDAALLDEARGWARAHGDGDGGTGNPHVTRGEEPGRLENSILFCRFHQQVFERLICDVMSMDLLCDAYYQGFTDVLEPLYFVFLHEQCLLPFRANAAYQEFCADARRAHGAVDTVGTVGTVETVEADGGGGSSEDGGGGNGSGRNSAGGSGYDGANAAEAEDFRPLTRERFARLTDDATGIFHSYGMLVGAAYKVTRCLLYPFLHEDPQVMISVVSASFEPVLRMIDSELYTIIGRHEELGATCQAIMIAQVLTACIHECNTSYSTLRFFDCLVSGGWVFVLYLAASNFSYSLRMYLPHIFAFYHPLTEDQTVDSPFRRSVSDRPPSLLGLLDAPSDAASASVSTSTPQQPRVQVQGQGQRSLPASPAGPAGPGSLGPSGSRNLLPLYNEYYRIAMESGPTPPEYRRMDTYRPLTAEKMSKQDIEILVCAKEGFAHVERCVPNIADFIIRLAFATVVLCHYSDEVKSRSFIYGHIQENFGIGSFVPALDEVVFPPTRRPKNTTLVPPPPISGFDHFLRLDDVFGPPINYLELLKTFSFRLEDYLDILMKSAKDDVEGHYADEMIRRGVLKSSYALVRRLKKDASLSGYLARDLKRRNIGQAIGNFFRGLVQ